MMPRAPAPQLSVEDLFDVGSSQPPGSGSITGAIDHSADAVGPTLPLSAFASASAIQLVKESSIGRVRKLGGGALVAYAPGSYLNETRSFVRYVIPPSSARWMSCATTSATRRSRSVPLAALMAADAASSQD